MRNYVYLSFRGADIRKTLISHLLSSLRKINIATFTSCESSSLDLHAIKKSEVAITVISKSSDSLDWWVDDVSKIIEFEKIGSLKTVPVFFQVNPFDVLSGLGRTKKVTKMDGNQTEKLERVKKWLDAHLTNKTCFISRDWKDDSELVYKITTFVSQIVFSDEIIPAGNFNATLDSSTKKGFIASIPAVYVPTENLSTDHSPLLCPSPLADPPPLPDPSPIHAPFPFHDFPLSSFLESSSPKRRANREKPTLNASLAPSPFGKLFSLFNLGTSSILSPRGSLLLGTTIDPSADLDYRRCCQLELSALVLGIPSPVVGICGQKGVGKTYLARQVYQKISPQFQHSLYLTNFSNKIQRQHQTRKPRGCWNKTYGPSLPLIFACKSLKESSFHGSSDDAIKEIIGRRKVLIVVDNVDAVEDLKSIIKDASTLGSGSRVIVITQDRSLLNHSGVKHIYEVECPRDEEALAFFSEFAFKQRKPFHGFEALSRLALKVSNHLPLALKVLGSFLCNKEKDEWVRTLHRLEASHDNYTIEVCRYIGGDDYVPRRPIKVDRHIGVDEVPFYRFALM